MNNSRSIFATFALVISINFLTCPNARTDDSNLPPAGAIGPVVAQFSGTWVTGCRDSSTTEITFAADQQNRVTYTSTYYVDSACTTEALRRYYIYNVTDTGVSGVDGNSIVYSLGSTTVAGEITISSSAVLSIANSKSYCGVTNWTVGQAESVLGRDCSDFFSAPTPYGIEVNTNPDGTIGVKSPDEGNTPTFHRP